MKNIHLILAFALFSTLFVACKPKQINLREELIPSEYLNNPAEMTFADSTFDFGTIKEGEKVKHIFKFTNTSKNDLFIAKGYGTCGCTVPEYPKDPIKPGESNIITVQFNSAGKKGNQKKKVVLEANTKTANVLFITAFVEVDSTKK